MRAVTCATAALAALLDWMLWGPRQHDADLRRSLGTVPRFIGSEVTHESRARA